MSSCAAGPTAPAALARTATVYFVYGAKPVKANRMSPVLFSYKYPAQNEKQNNLLIKHSGLFMRVYVWVNM